MPLSPEDLKEVQGVVQSAVTAAIKPVSDQVAQAQRAAENAHQLAQEASKLKPEAIKPLVDAALSAAETARKAEADKVAGDQAKKTAVAEKRKAYLADHAAKVPPAYHAVVPETDDEVQLKIGVDKAVAAFKADVDGGKYGIRAASVGASVPAASVPVDESKMSSTQKIVSGLSEGLAAPQPKN
jgi:hypothetical protein